MTDKTFEITLHNPSDVDIIDYPVSVYQLDKNGDPKVNTDTGDRVTTGEDTLVWTLLAGETAIFPKYVGDYLLSVYDFLIKVDSNPEKAAPSVGDVDAVVTTSDTATYLANVPGDSGFTCRLCGKVCGGKRALAMHMAVKHADDII